MSNLDWSSPVRQSNGTTLSPIPNEIYHEIFAYIRPPPTEDLNDNPPAKHDLCNLALVCRFFSATVLPWIFESICFDSKSGNRSSPLSRSENLFCRNILRGSRTARAMAQFVKKCEFMSWSIDDENEWISAEFLALYIDALAYMPNIQELTVTCTTISKVLLKAIGKIRNLSTLNVYNSHIAANVKPKHLKDLSSLKLTYCHIRPALSEELVRSINLNTLLHLTITAACIPSLFSRSNDVIPLEKLDVFELDGAPELEALLSRAPALKSLHIRRHEPSDLDLSHIKQASNSLPLLSLIEAPLSLVRFLTHKRSLSSITITNHDSRNRLTGPINSRDIEALLKSSPPIFHLGIPIDNHKDVTLWHHLPELQSLELNLGDKSQSRRNYLTPGKIIEEMAGVWAHFPRLRTLKFDFGRPLRREHRSLSEQHLWISETLAPHFPALRCCSFFDSVQWCYSEASGSWIPEIAHQYYLDLCSRGVVSERIPSLDYAGYLHRFISSKEPVDSVEFDTLLSRHRRRRLHE